MDKKEENYIIEAEKLNKAEIKDSRERICTINEIIDKTILLIREVNKKLCHRDLDPNDRRLVKACEVSAHLEDALESLALLSGYETATIVIDRANIEKD